ncbi:MAG: hypothetical protein QF728_00090 [Arenicellales bacterium]|nr:hypothetical protein [Arenicellales bacterium]
MIIIIITIVNISPACGVSLSVSQPGPLRVSPLPRREAAGEASPLAQESRQLRLAGFF